MSIQSFECVHGTSILDPVTGDLSDRCESCHEHGAHVSMAADGVGVLVVGCTPGTRPTHNRHSDRVAWLRASEIEEGDILLIDDPGQPPMGVLVDRTLWFDGRVELVGHEMGRLRLTRWFVHWDETRVLTICK